MRVLALTLAVLVAGCEKQTFTESEIREMTRVETERQVHDLRVASLKHDDQLKALGERLDAESKYLDVVGKTAGSVADLVAKNAKAANENALNDMTRRGACGTVWQPGPAGYVLANKRCTINDMAK